MHTLTVRISAALAEAIAEACVREQVSQSALVRRALQAYLQQSDSRAPFVSALDQAGDLVGCFGGGPTDLSSNITHLAGFGRT